MFLVVRKWVERVNFMDFDGKLGGISKGIEV